MLLARSNKRRSRVRPGSAGGKFDSVKEHPKGMVILDFESPTTTFHRVFETVLDIVRVPGVCP
jgi:hypothetical protein